MTSSLCYLESENGRGRPQIRNLNHVPEKLHDSPYLSSPIRPIPSFQRCSSRDSLTSSTVLQKKKKKNSSKVKKRDISPTNSEVGSLRLASPYSDSVFTCQSSIFGKYRQATNRTVLLPDEIDDIGFGLIDDLYPKNFHGKVQNDKDSNSSYHDDDEYGTSSDEDRTITSEDAKSIDDEYMLEKSDTMQDRKKDVLFILKDGLLAHKGKDISRLDFSHQDEEVSSINIKLPSVTQEISTIQHKKDKWSMQKIDKNYSKGNMKSSRSPYKMRM